MLPALMKLKMLPTLPTLKILPALQMLKMLPALPMLKKLPTLPMLKMLRSLAKLKMLTSGSRVSLANSIYFKKQPQAVTVCYGFSNFNKAPLFGQLSEGEHYGNPPNDPSISTPA
ncbi:MAG: hypothetical protein HLUCCA11_10575 [Phormidesmis priestleyi Ana]|uniref:Uncharacterized protein n=1 Tax=Phormidesmis priestleyi Ana TaxID=1666911 RepID=A0A0P7YYR2_9CYAN|nr:MAG: hypothetical protein HLUCCA11_10575 [Phormidesmis priestleyi Ana]